MVPMLGQGYLQIENMLASIERELEATFAAEDAVCDLARYLSRGGGKRVRPLLTLLSARLFGEEPAAVLPVAVAAELVHMATLVHDDIVDEAPLRRGHPTINALYGNQVAVLSGDALLARALRLLVENAPAPVVVLMAQMVYDMCEGEVDQHRNRWNWHQSEEAYFLRIEKKTARFFAACCEAGARMAGATPEEWQACHEYGLNLGMAFQVVDDLLDLTGSSEKMGKPVGSDLMEGSITLPVLRLLQDEAVRARLLPQLTTEPLTREVVDRVIEEVRRSDALEYARAKAAEFALAARERLARLPGNEAARLLDRLVDQVLERQA
ncbi:MAG: polyprenyl synthetase family protein [Limnochordales bacterium]|nr:polyprenyl synthetase family protein [Limnochordales bacterium]